MDYFELMGLPLSFKIDEAALRKKFYANSRAFHPDFFSLDDEEKQEWAVEQSTLNNAAFATLSDFDQRVAYILQLKGLLGDASNPDTLPQDFLMEMMDVNEAIMDLQMDFDPEMYERTLKTVDETEKELRESVQNIFENYQNEAENEADLKKVKNFHLKMKYLLRVRESLHTFASA
jgi:molecular chaperone HscB